MKKFIVRFLHFLVLALIAIIIVASCYISKRFKFIQFDELVFYYRMGLESADNGVVFDLIKIGFPYFVLTMFIFYFLFYDITFRKIRLRIRKFQLYPIKIINKHRIIFTSLIFIVSLGFLANSLNLFNHIKYTKEQSNFINVHYVNPKDTDIEFKKKRNLIVIYVESLETSFFTKKQGGHWKYPVTPELYELLNEDDSITFYDKNKGQGMKMITGASWTTASVIANTSAVPFKIPIEQNSYHSKKIMNGSYSLGDLLKDNGYYNEVISSADLSFGGLKEYFTRHGKYSIVDSSTLKKYDLKAEESDKGNWGLNDRFLFESAKKRLKKISKNKQPFNLELITIDTHFVDGFVGDYTLDEYETQYENVYATESKLIYDFVSWVKKQKFYKNTTIVIVGDHISMQNDYFDLRGIDLNERYVYNCIINAAVDTENNKKRKFTALDSYPTIVAAIGGKIDGDKLGLGVNLFSNKKTLIEKYKFDFLDEELRKKSNFYDDYILADKEFFEKNKVAEKDKK